MGRRERIKQSTVTLIFLVTALVLALVLVAVMLWPFAEPIGFALVLGVSLYPVHQRLSASIKNRTGSALLSTAAVFLLFIVPVSGIAYLISVQMVQLGQNFSTRDPTLLQAAAAHALAPFGSAGATIADRLSHTLQRLPQLASAYLVSSGTLIVAGFAGFAGETVVCFFVLFFLFRDGEKMAHILAFVMPLRERHAQLLFSQVRRSLVSNLYAIGAIALAQGALSLIAYLALSLSAPLTLAALTAVSSLIPVVGTAAVWVPAALYLAFKGHVLKCALLLAWGIFVIAPTDHFIRAKVAQGAFEINPLFLILSILGGIKVFGLLGIFLGPLLLALIEALIEVLRDEVIASKLEPQSSISP